MKYLKINVLTNIFHLLAFIYTFYFIRESSFLYYNSFDSPDFNEYFTYFEYFFNDSYITGREQGLSYYSLQSWFIFFFDSNYVFNEIEYALSRNIQNVNFLLYGIGLIGIYYLLDIYKVDFKSKLLTITTLNFLPIFIAVRLVFKPEILALSFLPWIIYFLEKYLLENKFKYLMYVVPLMTVVVTSKGSILIMVLIPLATYYFLPIVKLNSKNIFIASILFIAIFVMVTIENNSANGKNLFNISSGAETRANYDNKASLEVIYDINLYNLFTSPKKHDHATSMIGITLLDTFGDYFDIYWDNNSSGFSKNRINIIEFEQSNEIKTPKFSFKNKNITFYIQNLTDIYPRRIVGLFVSIFIFYQLFKNLLRKRKENKFLSFIFIGIFILAIHAITGFPKNNFDPLVGDTFKTLYYSFLVFISVSFLLANLYKTKLKYLLFITIFLSSIYIIGFPKLSTLENNSSEYQINYLSSFCEINNLLILSSDNILNCNSNFNIIEENHSYNIFDNTPRFSFWNNITLLISLFIILFSIFDRVVFKRLWSKT